ncbi:hypothetical protein BV20DRAFT_1043019 [Pilatotrama ljubarskyi]|nr:hypothetical protein BV20DRAFT_1043019 [Pilatotrama ljubarskyi]
MSCDTEPGGRRVPTLVQYCQRVAAAHANSFERLGEGFPEELIRPVLNSCSAETLWRLEEEDPYIADYTTDIWRTLCLKQWPLLVRDLEESGSESWKEEFARCQEEDANKLEKVAAMLRVKRQQDEEQKKASSIKITDRLPPAKRARCTSSSRASSVFWGVSTPPKTLFQKTRTEAAKLRKGVFSARMTRPPFQQRTLVSNAAGLRAPAPSTSTPTSAASGSRVTVRAVPIPRKPPPADRKPITPVKAMAGRAVPSPSAATAQPPAAASSPPPLPSSPPNARSPPPPRPPAKKDPASALFMPKHRAYSQLQARGVRSKS